MLWEICSQALIIVLMAAFYLVQITYGGNVTTVRADLFTYTGTRTLIGADPPINFMVLKVGEAEFPALGGQNVSFAILQYPSGSLNPLHSHPRSAELLFLLIGSLEVGFVDMSNKLYVQTLEAGDMFVFPKGFVHYQCNNEEDPAFAISTFGSGNVEIMSFPGTVFASDIKDDILAWSFKVDVSIVQKIKAGLLPMPY